MSALDDVIRLAPPPAEPADAVGDWTAVETALGLVLPADYKALVSQYGSGRFHDVSLLTPFDRRPEGWADLVAAGERLLDDHESFREEFPEAFPYPLYPEPGGILPWAVDGNGVQLCWLTGGDADQWPVVVWSTEGEAQRHDLSATGFLLAYLGGRIERPRSPRQPYFEPFRDRIHVYIRLTEGVLPYEQRLEILRARLAPTADRGNFADGSSRQDHFKALAHDWLLTYETAYGHQIRVAYPPEDDSRVRTVMRDAVRAMGCSVTRTTNRLGDEIWQSVDWQG